MPELQELHLVGCLQVTGLTLDSRRLRCLHLSGNRTLTELHLDCPRLEEVNAVAQNPGLAALAALRSVSIASFALKRLVWTNFPALVTLTLNVKL